LGAFLNAATSPLKSVVEMFLELVRLFIKTSKNFRFDFLNKKIR
jgi:hypothetical protein